MGRMGGKGDEIPIFHSPILPIFGRSTTFPTVPFVKISSPHSPTEKWEFLPLTDTHRHGGSCGCMRSPKGVRPQPDGARTHTHCDGRGDGHHRPGRTSACVTARPSGIQALCVTRTGLVHGSRAPSFTPTTVRTGQGRAAAGTFLHVGDALDPVIRAACDAAPAPLSIGPCKAPQRVTHRAGRHSGAGGGVAVHRECFLCPAGALQAPQGKGNKLRLMSTALIFLNFG